MAKPTLYLIVGLMAVIIGLSGWATFQGSRVTKLKAANEKLVDENLKQASSLKAYKAEISTLLERQNEQNRIEDEYEKLRAELKNKKNGPVADVLRYAIDADLVRP